MVGDSVCSKSKRVVLKVTESLQPGFRVDKGRTRNMLSHLCLYFCREEEEKHPEGKGTVPNAEY